MLPKTEISPSVKSRLSLQLELLLSDMAQEFRTSTLKDIVSLLDTFKLFYGNKEYLVQRQYADRELLNVLNGACGICHNESLY